MTIGEWTQQASRGSEVVDDRETVRVILNRLSPMHARILRWRFGLDDEDDHTLKEIGDKYNLSRERVRQLAIEALNIEAVDFIEAEEKPRWLKRLGPPVINRRGIDDAIKRATPEAKAKEASAEIAALAAERRRKRERARESRRRRSRSQQREHLQHGLPDDLISTIAREGVPAVDVGNVGDLFFVVVHHGERRWYLSGWRDDAPQFERHSAYASFNRSKAVATVGVQLVRHALLRIRAFAERDRDDEMRLEKERADLLKRKDHARRGKRPKDQAEWSRRVRRAWLDGWGRGTARVHHGNRGWLMSMDGVTATYTGDIARAAKLSEPEARELAVLTERCTWTREDA